MALLVEATCRSYKGINILRRLNTLLGTRRLRTVPGASLDASGEPDPAGQDQVLLSFKVEREIDGTFSIWFTDKEGRERKKVSEVRQLHVRYRFRCKSRCKPLALMFKHDVICWYGVLIPDQEYLEIIWKQQDKFLREGKKHGLIPFVYPFDTGIEVSTTV